VLRGRVAHATAAGSAAVRKAGPAGEGAGATKSGLLGRSFQLTCLLTWSWFQAAAVRGWMWPSWVRMVYRS
jgi:hypothetical protein